MQYERGTGGTRIAEALGAPGVPLDRAGRIIVAPDCGLKYLSREVAYGKMKAMVEGAEMARKAL